MKTKRMMMAALTSLLLATPVGSAVKDDENADAEGEQCHFDYVFQVNVVGDNTIDCTAQYCASGPAGAGSAGVGVGTAGGKGEAGAVAAAGTGCHQSSNKTGAFNPWGAR